MPGEQGPIVEYDSLPIKGGFSGQVELPIAVPRGEFLIINGDITRKPKEGEDFIDGREENQVIETEFMRNKVRGIEDDISTDGPIAGVHYVGIYETDDPKIAGAKVSFPIVSFTYNKLGKDGELEMIDRVIILLGEGYGQHKEHTGQEPSEYLVGPQVGTRNRETGEVTYLDSGIQQAKSFSVACIVNNPHGEAVLANPQ